jgi:hypothetical protein
MITSDQCLQHLVALVASNDERPLSLAKGYLDAFVPLVHADRANGARMLSELKGRLTRQTAPSPLRTDVLDLVEARIVRMSDPLDELEG